MGPYIFSGIVVGSIYAISALGLVMTYQSSRVFNFAHGAMAYAIAVFYYSLTCEHDWPIEIAAPFTILIVAPLLGLVLYGMLFRQLTHLSPTVRLVATVGLWVALPAVVRILWPVVRENVFDPQGIVNNPVDDTFVKVFGVWLNTNQFVTILCAVGIALVTWVALRFTTWGLATRATVDHPANASIAGVNTEAVTAFSWMFGAMLAGFAGVLLAPLVGMLEYQYTLLLVGSFVAVVIGRMSSLPLAFAGAIFVGLLQSFWLKIQPESGWLAQGFSESIPFLVMLVFIIAYSFGRGGLRREAFSAEKRRIGGVHGDAPPLPPAHGWKRAAGPLVCAVVLAIVPFVFDGTTIFGATFDSFWMTIFNQGLALAIIFLSYTLVTGEGGMLALSQITFAGIGAFAAARLAADAGFPVWLAILVGALVAVPFGLLVALPSLRIGDLYLAMLTIGFALVIEKLVWSRPEYDNLGQGLPAPEPFGLSALGGDSKFLITLNDRTWMYILFAIIFGVLALLVINAKRATTGLVFAAIRSSETASSTTGISIVRAKLVIFAVSAFIAGLGGALYSSTIGTTTAAAFTVTIGIIWLAIVVTWGVRSVLGALLAGMVFAIAPQKLSVILIIGLVIVSGGLIAQLVTSGKHRTPLGVLAIAAMAVAVLAASIWIWDHVTEIDAVNTILVLVAFGAGFFFVSKILRSESLPRPAGIGLAVVVAAGALWFASQFAFGGIHLDEVTAGEIPVMMFGLGAIVLAKEPRGVVYDIVNRQRLRGMHDEERIDEERLLATELEEAVPRQ